MSSSNRYLSVQHSSELAARPTCNRQHQWQRSGRYLSQQCQAPQTRFTHSLAQPLPDRSIAGAAQLIVPVKFRVLVPQSAGQPGRNPATYHPSHSAFSHASSCAAIRLLQLKNSHLKNKQTNTTKLQQQQNEHKRPIFFSSVVYVL